MYEEHHGYAKWVPFFSEHQDIVEDAYTKGCSSVDVHPFDDDTVVVVTFKALNVEEEMTERVQRTNGSFGPSHRVARFSYLLKVEFEIPSKKMLNNFTSLKNLDF